MFTNFLGEVKGIYNRLTLIELGVSLIWLVIGIILITEPSMSNTIFSIILGTLFLARGISSLYSFIKREDIVLYNFNIFYGIIMILLGVLALILKNVLQVVLGLYFLISGIQKITYGLFLKRFGETSWLLTLVVGVLFIVIGIFSFFSTDIIQFSGICLVGYGIMDIANIILLRKRSRYYIA